MKPDLCLGVSFQPCHTPCDLAAPGADQPGKSQNLALVHCERHIAIAFVRKAGDAEYLRTARACQLWRIKRIQLAAHHGVDHVRRGDVCRAVRADVLAVAHHRDAVAVLEDFRHAVRDVDDADPLGRQPAHDAEQLLRLVIRQGCGRFVQDQDAAIQRQGLCDLDQLLLGDRQQPGRCPWVDVGQRRQHLGCPGDKFWPAHEATAGSGGLRHEDVFGHRDISAERDFLMHKSDPQTLGSSRAVDLDQLPVNADGSTIWLQDAVDDVHQG